MAMPLAMVRPVQTVCTWPFAETLITLALPAVAELPRPLT